MPSESKEVQTELNFETIVLYVSDLETSRMFYENTLGLRVLDVNSHVATFWAGHVQLCLLPAGEYGVTLPGGRDRSANISIMVHDLQRIRDALEARGVRFSRTLEYIIGMTADFYDPDGHWFSLYQPSETAFGWPSGPKLKALASSLSMRVPPAPEDAATSNEDLAEAFIAYVFLFFSDPKVAEGFYGGVLGLDAIEGGPCRRVPTSVDIGVVKYDVGTSLLATHHIESDDKRFRVSTVGTGGVALAFQVADLKMTVDELSRRGIEFSDWSSESPIGTLAKFTDPVGHVLLLRESIQKDKKIALASMSANSVKN